MCETIQRQINILHSSWTLYTCSAVYLGGSFGTTTCSCLASRFDFRFWTKSRQVNQYSKLSSPWDDGILLEICIDSYTYCSGITSWSTLFISNSLWRPPHWTQFLLHMFCARVSSGWTVRHYCSLVPTIQTKLQVNDRTPHCKSVILKHNSHWCRLMNIQTGHTWHNFLLNVELPCASGSCLRSSLRSRGITSSRFCTAFVCWLLQSSSLKIKRQKNVFQWDAHVKMHMNN